MALAELGGAIDCFFNSIQSEVQQRAGVEFQLKRPAMVQSSAIVVTQVKKDPDIFLKSSIEVSWVPRSAEILEAEYPITLFSLLRPSGERMVHRRSFYRRPPPPLVRTAGLIHIDIYIFIER